MKNGPIRNSNVFVFLEQPLLILLIYFKTDINITLKSDFGAMFCNIVGNVEEDLKPSAIDSAPKKMKT